MGDRGEMLPGSEYESTKEDKSTILDRMEWYRGVCDLCGEDTKTTRLCRTCLKALLEVIEIEKRKRLPKIILLYVRRLSAEANEGAYIWEVEERISSEHSEYDAAQVRREIEMLLIEGVLRKSQDGFRVKLAPGVCVCGFSSADHEKFSRHVSNCKEFQREQEREAELRRRREEE